MEARDKAEAEEMKRLRQQGAEIAIEDAVNTRTERIRLEVASAGEPAASGPTLEAQEIPSQNFSNFLPTKFVTPKSREAKSYKLFPESPLLGSLASKSEIPISPEVEGESTQLESQKVSPWKTTPTEMESWTPKARNRG